MQVYKVGKCVVVVALALLLLSCASSPARLKPVEEVLGKGWVCYTAPDGYKLAGIVVEVTNDGKYIFDADYSSLSIETQSSIGSVTTNNTTTFGGVVRLLESFKAVDKDASFTADLTRKADLAVTYGGTMKQMLPGKAVEAIADEHSKRKLVPTSTYILFRESHSAKSVDTLINDSIVAGLGLTAKLNQLVDVNPKISRDSSSRYKPKEEYGKPIGICTIATELIPEKKFDGNTTLRVGNQISVPTDIVITDRK